MEHTSVICRACPKALTREQVRRGCRACSRACGGKRFRPFAPRRCKVCPHQLEERNYLGGKLKGIIYLTPVADLT